MRGRDWDSPTHSPMKMKHGHTTPRREAGTSGSRYSPRALQCEDYHGVCRVCQVLGIMSGLVDVASSAARNLLSRGVEEYAKLRGSNDLGLDLAVGSPTALLLLPVLYMVYRRLYFQSFGRLKVMPAGAGKQGDNWLWRKAAEEKSQSDLEVTWLGKRELKVLQACGDTLLPGFEIGTKEAADTAVEQVGSVCCVATLPLPPSRRSPGVCCASLTIAPHFVCVLESG